MNQNLRHSIYRFTPPVALMIVIFAFSSMSTLPQFDTPWWDILVKKGGHLFGFGLLYFLWVKALIKKEAYLTRRVKFTAALITIGYAVFDEMHQSLIPGRHPSLYDVLIDSSGIIIVHAITGLVGIRYTDSTLNK